MDKQLKDEKLKSRRGFIKKAAYVAPTIIALGTITKPVSAAASCVGAQCYDQDNNGPIGPGPSEKDGFKGF